MLARTITLHPDEVVKSLKESQQLIGVDKSSNDNQILVSKGWQRNNYGDINMIEEFNKEI
jgi:hypothetical protein